MELRRLYDISVYPNYMSTTERNKVAHLLSLERKGTRKPRRERLLLEFREEVEKEVAGESPRKDKLDKIQVTANKLNDTVKIVMNKPS